MFPIEPEQYDTTSNDQFDSIARVWERLMDCKRNPDPIDAETQYLLVCDILRKLNDGWTESECFRMIFRTEYFDNETSEERCLEIMRRINKEVEERLHLARIAPEPEPPNSTRRRA
jgi:hypothetical protein